MILRLKDGDSVLQDHKIMNIWPLDGNKQHISNEDILVDLNVRPQLMKMKESADTLTIF